MQDVPYGFCHCGCGQRTEPAIRNYPPRGHVKGEPKRFVKHHQRRKYQSLEERYIVQDCGYETPCWVWQAGCTKSFGHGQVRWNGRTRTAHSVLYERVHGPTPPGLELDHLCRNPPCVNPAHLEPVTHAVNMRRGLAAKLTAEQVQRIRERTDETVSSLAREFNVTRTCIYSILKRETWKDV